MQQEPSSAVVTTVTTAAEFTAAVKLGASHIEIQRHLDLTGWSSTLSSSHPGGSSAFEVPTSVQSVRV